MSTTICIFGDSIVWGATDPVGGGWAGRLRAYFEADPESDVAAYNLGICGDTSEGLLKRVMAESEARKPQVIVFAIGINDSAYLGSKGEPVTGLERFYGNLLELARQARVVAGTIIFVGLAGVDETRTMPVAWDQEIFYDNENVAAYDDAIGKASRESGALFIRISGLLDQNDFDDGLHPGSAGHQKMFEKIITTLLGGENILS